MSAEQATSQQAKAGSLIDPTDYHLKGDGVTINYSATSISGKPLFSYKDATHDLNFIGDEIERAQSPAGTLVTVTIEPNNDAREIKVTLIVPIIKLRSQTEKLDFSTFAIETTDRSVAFVAPPGPAGVLQTYRAHHLRGEAEFTVS